MKVSKLICKTAALFMAMALVFAGCSSGDDGGSVKGEVEGGAENGSIGITVNVDGTISCSFCKKTYQKKADAEACEHYVCAVCGSVYNSQEAVDACTSHVTVRFVDSTNSHETIENTIKTGNSVQFPVWTVEGSDTIWTADVDGYSEESESFNDNVTFTASWKTFVECAECGEHCDDEAAAEAHALADKTCDECGTVCENKAAAEAHVLADKTCDECNTVCENKAAAEAHAAADKHCSNCSTDYASKAEADACKTQEGCPAYTIDCENCHTSYKTAAEVAACTTKRGCASWTGFAVTFVDSSETNKFEDVTVDVKTGDKVTVPATWKKDGFTLVWTSSVEGLTPADVITADVTFTAKWCGSVTYGLHGGAALTKNTLTGTITGDNNLIEKIDYVFAVVDNGAAYFKNAVAGMNMTIVVKKPCTLKLDNNKTVIVGTEMGNGTEFAANAEVDLTAGTWYITRKNTGDSVKMTSISFIEK